MPERKLRPQLVMSLPSLDGLPSVQLPAGYAARHFRSGDETAWDRVIDASFGPNAGRAFAQLMAKDAAFRPERVWFLWYGDEPVATTSAWHRPEWGEDCGYIHYVGVIPTHSGKGLGTQINLVALHHMVREGRRKAALETDDFRLPALKIYLRLGFKPLLVHENQRQRWRSVFAQLGKPGLAEDFHEELEGPVTPKPSSA
jgi:mycothiol synthase